MSNVIQMDQWLTDRMSEQERYVMERGADIWVSLRTGRYQGLLSEAPADVFLKARQLMRDVDAQWGGTFESAVAFIDYDDKTDSGHEISIYRGLSGWFDEPVEGAAEINTADSLVHVEVSIIDDDAADYLLNGGAA